MAKAEVLPLTAADIPVLVRDMREADRAELEEALGLDVAASLSDDLEGSKIVCNGHLLAAFGDSKHDEDTGVPWLISTVHIEKFPRAFLSVCKPEIRLMLTRHRFLVNYVDVRNTTAIRWIGWLGFTFAAPVSYGPNGYLFHPFYMTRD